MSRKVDSSFVIALGGIIGILNPAHNKNAVWKS